MLNRKVLFKYNIIHNSTNIFQPFSKRFSSWKNDSSKKISFYFFINVVDVVSLRFKHDGWLTMNCFALLFNFFALHYHYLMKSQIKNPLGFWRSHKVELFLLFPQFSPHFSIFHSYKEQKEKFQHFHSLNFIHNHDDVTWWNVNGGWWVMWNGWQELSRHLVWLDSRVAKGGGEWSVVW